ncbi:hypothetical protein [Marinomonas aquiplantarum]|uniref:C2H2-type domain-containing protein n=1 Tax=Marinomonas aquiplantarum TaxID=491951 RepID=A0A366D1Z3_9GAMM|nr:hypothetical protein [Marinomonas aquiplantarum]RBO83966.1 hypothetical protein DFP76_103240 [Marinomonas aquiplantarum]
MDSPSELVECPKCKVLIRSHRLKKHLKKVHSPQAEVLRLTAEREKMAKKEIDNSLVICHVCNCQIKSKNLIDHCAKTHGLYPSQVTQATNTGKNRFNSSREREAFWREKLGPDAKEDQQDIFEKKLVLNGGTYGLGKNRKH